MNIHPINHHGLNWIIGLIMLASLSAVADNHNIMRVGGSAESIYDSRITDVEILFTVLFNEMFKDQNEEFKIKIYDTDQALTKELAAGNLDAVFMDTVLYLDNFEYLHPEIAFAVQHGQSIKPKYILLVRRNSGIDSLHELENKKIIIPSGHAVGKRFLDVELMHAGLPVSNDHFSEIRQTKESNTAIIKLFFNQVDAALVTDFSYEVASELNLQIPQSLEIIETSPPFIHMVISVRKDFPRHRVEKIFPYLENLEEIPRLQHLRKSFRFQGLHRISTDEVYDVRQLSGKYVRLRSEREIP
ncbi:MAG: PhnD/SsuA/transferrin family substrate-binding protein [Candidatus Thiodiazotropha endolucinida]